MNDIPVYILANDKHIHLVEPFAYMWRKYVGTRHVTVAGFSSPKFEFPSNFSFISLGEQLPVEKWSNGLIELLDRIDSKYAILMLEDYWMTAPIDSTLSEAEILEYIDSDDILKFDLSGSRIGKGKGYKVIDESNGIKVIESKPGSKYQMCFQAGIWNLSNMRRVLKYNENPWQAEVDGTPRVDEFGLRVRGTTPRLWHYKPAFRCRKGEWHLESFDKDDLDRINSIINV